MKKRILSITLTISILISSGIIITKLLEEKKFNLTEENLGINSINKDDYKEGIKSSEYIKILGKGMDVDWSKTKKGREYYNIKAVKDFKEAGISHVRIRIADNVTEELLVGLDNQINDCIKNGLIPIIAYQADEFKTNPSEDNINNVVQWWKIVSERYKNYSNLLAFDLIIEPSDDINKKPEKLNKLYGKIIPEIRKTNEDRIIMIAPRMRSDADYLKELKIPTENRDYIIAEWHFYASGPSKTNDRKLWTNGNINEMKLITDKINTALEWQEETGIPTWVGAWMPGNYNDGDDYSIDEQVEFAKYMVQQLDKAKIPFAINSDTSFYERESNKWIEKMKPVFEVIFN